MNAVGGVLFRGGRARGKQTKGKKAEGDRFADLPVDGCCFVAGDTTQAIEKIIGHG